MTMEIFENLMRRCLEIASQYRFDVAPNPMVGAIIFDEKTGEIISEGAHQKYGEAHAEVNAINNTNIDDFSDKTLIVNLEPCSHQGKTPPCADLIARLGFKKVVVGTRDLNPLVGGRGIQKLKDSGIEVVEGVLEKECLEFNKVFFKNIEKKLPYVVLKIGTTFDSKIATLNGESKWITSEKSRQRVQYLRSNHFGILSGCGTILADNPNLNCRIDNLRSPDRIIIDRYGKVPFSYNVFKDDGTRVFLATNNLNRTFPKNVIPVEFKDFNDLFSKLFDYGIYSIFVEAIYR